MSDCLTIAEIEADRIILMAKVDDLLFQLQESEKVAKQKIREAESAYHRGHDQGSIDETNRLRKMSPGYILVTGDTKLHETRESAQQEALARNLGTQYKIMWTTPAEV